MAAAGGRMVFGGNQTPPAWCSREPTLPTESDSPMKNGFKMTMTSGTYAVGGTTPDRPSSLVEISRILNFCTFPVTVIGNSSLIRMYRGTL